MSSISTDDVVSEEKENFLRFFLLLEFSTKTLHDYLGRYFQVNDPTEFYKELQSVKNELKLNPAQKQKLFPKNKKTVIDQIDITLTSLLLRTSKCTPNPCQADLDVIDCVRKNRNAKAHAGIYSISTPDFRQQWGDLTNALVKLGADINVIQRLYRQTLDAFAYYQIIDKDEQLKNLKDKNKGVWHDIQPTLKEFHGRYREINDIHVAMLNDASRGCVIAGYGGVGKTQLVIKYSNQYVTHYTGNVIWINSDTRSNIEKSFNSVANFLNLTNPKGTEEEVDAKSIVLKVYRFFTGTSCLFVFDDANDVKLVTEYLPKLPPGVQQPKLLITSQSIEWGSQFVVIPLDVFTDNEAKEFVENSLGLDVSNRDEVQLLCKELGNLPLALQQAVSFIKKHVSVEEYNRMLQTCKLKLLNREIKLECYSKNCIRTFDLAKNKLFESGDEDAIELLNLMSYMDGKHITRKFLQNFLSDEFAFTSALDVLAEYSLIRFQGNNIYVHSLIQCVIRYEITSRVLSWQEKISHTIFPSKTYPGILLGVIKGYVDRVDVNTEDDEEIDSLWVTHLVSLFKHCKEENFVADYILDKNLVTPMCDYYEDMCQYNTGYNVFLNMFEEYSKKYGPENRKLLNLQNCRAMLLEKFGRKRDALEIFYMVENGYKNAKGENHVFTLGVKINKLSCLLNCGLYKHAEIEVTTIKKSFKKLDRKLQIIFNDLQGSLLFIQGNFTEALKLIEKYKGDVLSRCPRDNSRRLCSSQYSIANCYFRLGKYEEAKEIFEEVKQRYLGFYKDESHEKVYIAKRSIAKCLLYLNKTDEALEMLDEVLTGLLEQFDEYNAEYLSAEYFKVIGLIDKKDIDAAKAIIVKNIHKRSDLIGEVHEYVLLSKFQFARCLVEEMQIERAKNELLVIETNQKTELGELHPDVLETQFYLGLCYSKLGDAENALLTLNNVFKGQEKTLGSDHPSTKKTREFLNWLEQQ